MSNSYTIYFTQFTLYIISVKYIYIHLTHSFTHAFTQTMYQMEKTLIKRIAELRKKLPQGYASEIVKRLKTRNISITRRNVYAVMSLQRTDKHGIIDEAIKIAKEEANRKQTERTKLNNKLIKELNNID